MTLTTAQLAVIIILFCGGYETDEQVSCSESLLNCSVDAAGTIYYDTVESCKKELK